MNSRQKSKITVKEIAVFGMLGALMYASKVLMDVFPNIHFLASITVALTVVYRKKALYPIYLFVLLLGLLNGFSTWWIPHLYIWTLLWGVIMALPKNLSGKKALLVYSTVSSLHGFLYGVIYAPVQAIVFNLDLEGITAWIAAGLPFDIIHGVSNFLCGLLILPLVELLIRTDNMVKRA